MKRQKVYLTLQNGKAFEGYRFGADGDRLGELVFTTGMVGYDKTLTDPAYHGQIVVQTFPLIGNYGVIESEFESETPCVAAYVVREVCSAPSNFRTERTLDEYLKEKGVVGIYGVDTRELTRIIRSEGVMNACISSKPLADLSALNAYALTESAEEIYAATPSTHGDEKAEFSVAFWNFGAKKNAVTYWVENGCFVKEIPAKTTAEEILAMGVDGVIVSEGAGDPKANGNAIAQLQKLLGKIPVFGVGLGYQMLALALGADTVKMKYGHRGANQPVKYLESGRVYVSSQNHGYEVEKNSVKTGKVTFVNVNDGGIEGIEYADEKAFGVQFSVESCSAAGEANFLVKKFVSVMKKEKENA